MKKILVVSPFEADANSFWRCMGPFNYLAKYSREEITVVSKKTEQGINWVDIMGVDLLFLHRPCRRDDLTLMQMAYNCGVPVWVDFDDWLFDVPGWNPNAPAYNNSTTQNFVAQCLATADVVTCSTEALADQFRKVNSRIVILQNAYRSDLFPYREKEIQKRNHTAYWRGSNTHEGDVLSVRDGFKDLPLPIQFLGRSSWLLLSGMHPSSYQTVADQDFLVFNRYIYDLKPKLMVFPLVDCLFNRCKSNIAYIEAMHAGALVVAPDLPEWKHPGIFTYQPHDPKSFKETIFNTFELSERTAGTVVNGCFEEMKAKYDIAIINEKRKTLALTLEKTNTKSPFDPSHGMYALSILKGLTVSG